MMSPMQDGSEFWVFCESNTSDITYNHQSEILSKHFMYPGDRGSIQDRVIPKTQIGYMMPPGLTLSIIRYG